MASIIHHRITIHVYDQMIEAGILTEDDPVELINGELSFPNVQISVDEMFG